MCTYAFSPIYSWVRGHLHFTDEKIVASMSYPFREAALVEDITTSHLDYCNSLLLVASPLSNTLSISMPEWSLKLQSTSIIFLLKKLSHIEHSFKYFWYPPKSCSFPFQADPLQATSQTLLGVPFHCPCYPYLGSTTLPGLPGELRLIFPNWTQRGPAQAELGAPSYCNPIGLLTPHNDCFPASHTKLWSPRCQH